MRRPLVLGICIAFLGSSSATALSFGFENISNNLAGDAAIGEAQLFVDVTDAGSDQVLFTFSNTGPDLSSITDVYFDDGSLLSIAQVIDPDSGVSFSEGASPGNLPSGANADPAFIATAGFSADSNPPTQPMGVNPGETLGILFDLQGSQTFADVLDELDTGALRIGIHVQGFATGGSESFVNGPPIPEPSAAILYGLAVAAIGWRTRRAPRSLRD